MNNPALKGEVSRNKMLSQTSPRLRRNNVMFHSVASCISNASKKFSRAPEMSLGEILPQPGMFMQQFEGTVTFEQSQCFTNAHRRRQLDKQMDVVNSDVQLIDFTPISPSSRVQNSFAVNPDSEKLHRVFGILRFPDKMESILSERMFSGFQIHFFAPAKSAGNEAHANFAKFSSGGATAPLVSNQFKELNIEDGNSSLGFKTEVSLPLM